MGGLRLKLSRLLLGATALIVVTGCAQPDVEETLHCELSGDGTAEIAFEVIFPDLSSGEVDEARRERVATLQQFYLEGWDPWAARFEQAGQAGDRQARETLSWEKVGGTLHRLTRTAHLEGPEALDAFFADTDLTVLFTADPQESEFAIFAGSSSRATGEERERLERLLAGWSRAAAGYLHEVADLYDYLEDHPDRAEIIFEAIFGDYAEGIHAFEEERLERLIEAFLEVLDIAEATDDEGDSLEHLARLVYDPFPARMSVAVDGRVLAGEGFVALADREYEVPPLGLDRALGDLEQRWIEPPLLTTYERLERLGDDAGFDIAEFAARPRQVAELPSAAKIAEAVEEALAPAPAYRLRWQPDSPHDSDEPSDDGPAAREPTR